MSWATKYENEADKAYKRGYTAAIVDACLTFIVVIIIAVIFGN
jgi:hypothetical protein